MVVCKQAIYRGSLAWWRCTESCSMIALHAYMHHWLFLFYLDTAASSLTYSYPGQKKSIYIRRIMCFEKPSDIRIWLMCTMHCGPNLKGTHTLIVYIVVSTTQFPPMGESLFRQGVTNSAWAYTSIHRNELSSSDMPVIYGVNYRDVFSSVLHICSVSALMSALAY